MNFYSDKNVYEATLERIDYIFEEFKDRKIVVDFSGGKDSTALLHLVKEVMDRRGIKRIPVFFLDQEGEAPQVVEYVREVMHYDWVEPFWVQSFFQEWNSSEGKWFNVWGPGEKWMREKEPNNPYTECDFDTKCHFRDVLDSAHRYLFGDDYVCLGGVRTDESPSRRNGLTLGEVYKGISWGKRPSAKAYCFYPLWDWRTYDVWFYIFSNRHSYCKLYNYWMTKKPLIKCRVSSFIHENSIQMLKEIKEVSPQFYAAALRRIANVNTTVQSYEKLCEYVNELPSYFESWQEYIHYLADHIIAEEKSARSIVKSYEWERRRLLEKVGKWQEGRDYLESSIGRVVAKCIVAEDNECSKMFNSELTWIKYIKSHTHDIERANQEGV